MNPIYRRFAMGGTKRQHAIFSFGATFGFVLLSITFLSAHVLAQNSDNSILEFKRLAQELSTNRTGGGAEAESQQEKALGFLDAVVISVLNASESPQLDAANQRLAGFTSRTPPIGENYRLVKLGGSPAAYALVVNFGLGGPAAVRIYAGAAGKYVLAARIDQFSQKGFPDSDIELVPAASSSAVFVTVAGRTDDLATGIFSAWSFDGHAIVALWTSDVLEQSNYEADATGFHLTYCGQPDEDRPGRCLQMTRDLYHYEEGQWKRLETGNLPPAKANGKPAAK